MAKNNKKTTIAIISLIIVVIGIIAGVIKGYADMEAEAKTHTANIETIKEEGCLPAREGKTKIQIIQKDIETIKKTQEKMDGKLDKLLERK